MNRDSIGSKQPRSNSILAALYVLGFVVVLGLLSSLQAFAKDKAPAKPTDASTSCEQLCDKYGNAKKQVTSASNKYRLTISSTGEAVCACQYSGIPGTTCLNRNGQSLGQVSAMNDCKNPDKLSKYTPIFDQEKGGALAGHPNYKPTAEEIKLQEEKLAEETKLKEEKLAEEAKIKEAELKQKQGDERTDALFKCGELEDGSDAKKACLKAIPPAPEGSEYVENAEGDKKAPGADGTTVVSNEAKGGGEKAGGEPKGPATGGTGEVSNGDPRPSTAGGEPEKATHEKTTDGFTKQNPGDPSLASSNSINLKLLSECEDGTRNPTSEECTRNVEASEEHSKARARIQAAIDEHCKLVPSDKKCIERKGTDNSSATTGININGKCGNTAMMAMTTEALDGLKKSPKDPKYPTVKGEDGKERYTKAALMQYIEDNGIRNEMEDKYNCDADEDTLHAFEVTSQMLDVSMQVGTGISSGIAVANTQNAALNGEDVFVEGAQQMKNTMIATGTQQSIVGAGQIVMSIAAGTMKGKHSDGIEALDTAQQQQGSRAVSGGSKDQRGMSAVGASVYLRQDEDNVDAKEVEGIGRQQMDAMRGVHSEMKAKANATMTQLVIQGAMNAAGGAAKLAQGLLMEVPDAADTSSDLPPLTAATPNGVVEEGVAPPSFDPTATGNEIVADGLEDTTDNGGTGGDIPPPLLGAGPGGGLKESPVPGGGGGFLGAAGTSSGGGGSGGGGLGGGGPSADGGGESGSESLATGAVKFDPAGGGNAGVGFAGGAGAARRNGDTGMDLNGLLAQFLPKKEETGRAPAGSILDYGDGKKKTIGPGDQDDGSILGPNSNLFMRVSNTMMTKFKKGSLQ